MKKMLLALLAFGSCAAMAIDKPQLEQRAQKVIAKFQLMQEKPDKRIPPEVLAKAQGVILLDRMKAGFVFAYQGGAGLALVKDKQGKWSAPAFMNANEASLGFQIGGQQSFFVILLMNEESVRSLVADAAFEFGGEARGTAGDQSTGVDATAADVQRAVLVYDDRKGLFGGAAIKGGAISPDHESNLIYYGAPVTMKEILFDKKVKSSETGQDLAAKLNKYSKKTG